MTDILWHPSNDRIAAAAVTRFRHFANDRFDAAAADYPALYQWSIEQPEAFWTAVWKFTDVIASRPWTRVLTHREKMPGARWFEGSRLNFAENLLRHRGDRPALIFRGEDKIRIQLSFDELRTRSAQLAAALHVAGVRPGDRVAGFLPNLPEAVIAMLASTHLGALWSSCSPDFGVTGVFDRFGQIRPKVLFTADGYWYKGRARDSLATIRALLPRLPEIERVIVVPYVEPTPDTGFANNAVLWSEFIDTDAPVPPFAQLPFDHPLYIMYSSGTTGRPKCIVHGAGGTLLQHLKEHVLHTDIGITDRVFYFTTCGWMMWNWLVSGLASGATLMLYDGSPVDPEPDTLFRFATEERITVFGTSAKYLSAIEKTGLRPGQDHDLRPLRTILSTGSPLTAESFDYVYRQIKADVQLSSISGGTDIISCFALGNPVLPVRRGELQCRGLGMRVEIFNDAGRAVHGQKGELVCRAPFPSMPVGFWEDPEDEKYRAAYFARWPGVWAHGDYAELTPSGGIIIHGRSDAVLNPGGVRIGTAEIYRQVEKLPQILESIAVAQRWQEDVRVILFVKLREGLRLDEDLRERIRSTIRQNTTPRHVPAKIIQVADIPHTISGKIVELAVRKVIHGQPVTNLDALANPEALELYRDLPDLTTA